MSRHHLQPRILRHLLSGRPPTPEDFDALIAHLEGGCVRCGSVLAEIAGDLSPEENRRLQAALDRVFKESLESSSLWSKIYRLGLTQLQLLELEESLAKDHLEEILKAPPAARLARLKSSQRFHSVALFELLLKESEESRFREVARTMEFAQLAHELALLLDSTSYGKDLVVDLKAKSWSQIGNAYRLFGRFREADEALNDADRLAAKGSGDPLLKGRLLDIRASVRKDQRHFSTASPLLEAAFDAYMEAGQHHYAGRALVSQGVVVELAGEPEKAIPLLIRALELIDAKIEPRTPFIVRHNLITALCQTGRAEEAEVLLSQHRSDYFELGESRHPTKLLWVEGKIAAALDRLEEAESFLQRAADQYLAESDAFLWAVVCLELAVVYARQGRTTELKALANRLFQAFEAFEVHRDAFAALVLFKKAAEAEKATISLLEQVSKTLLRNPRPVPEQPS